MIFIVAGVIIGLNGMLDDAGIKANRNDFEKLYSDLVTGGKNQALAAQIDRAIFDYFAALELPDSPTLYDHLVLSLQSKDVIATFNWDPLLWQALARHWHWRAGALPSTLFLHGNTAVGYCFDHKPMPVRPRGQLCPQCKKPLQDGKLLYPVTEKNYNNDPFIAKNWEALRGCLGNAFLLTVFGYSAPATDVEAVSLLKAGWGDPGQRELEEFEVIDIKDEEELYGTWKPFIHGHHYQTRKSFFDSIIGRNPRRSCEVMWNCMVDMDPVGPNPIPQAADWDELHAFYDVLFEDERNHQRR